MEVIKTTGNRAFDEEINRIIARLNKAEAGITKATRPTVVPSSSNVSSAVPTLSLMPFNNGDSGTGTVTLNFLLGNNQVVTLTGSCTIAFANLTAGFTYTLKIIQDSTGSWTVTWPGSGIAWQAGTAPTLTTTAGLADLLGFYYDGATMVGYVIAQAF